MNNPYCRKHRLTFKQFLAYVPKLDGKYMRDLYPDRPIEECTEIVIYHKRYEEDKRAYFKRHKFYYLLAKLLNRKEVK